jgi:hypothetical protein
MMFEMLEDAMWPAKTLSGYDVLDSGEFVALSP